jgi:hypothetical protein
MGGNNYKKLPYLLLLLLAIGAATLSVSVLHKMRERRLLSVLLQEREQQLMSLQVRLEVWIRFLACHASELVCYFSVIASLCTAASRL